MCIITTHAIFISSPKQNIMNTDSKLKRFVVLLDKAPFVLFLESTKYMPHPEHLIPVLKIFNLSFTNVLTTAPIQPDQDLRKIISATNTLEDPLAYNIIEALATNTSLSNGRFFPKHYFTANDWQQCVEWQNVDNEPEPTKDVVVAVCKLTHDLRIFNSEKPVNLDCDGQIVLTCLDRSAPFPQALLKECAMEVYDIIVQMSVGRVTADKIKSKYLLVMQTGHETFNYINLRRIENDLTAVLATFNIAVENIIFT